MSKSDAKDYLPLVQALAEGKTIQVKNNNGEWVDRAYLHFNLAAERYRIKPEPEVIFAVYRGASALLFARTNQEAERYMDLYRSAGPYTTKKFIEVVE